jgi:hypothetical protein
MPAVKSRLALLGGLIHIAAAIGILFFPVFTTCMNQSCYGESYIQLGGNALGYSFLLLMIAAGIAAIYSSFIPHVAKANIIRIFIILASVIVIFVAGFSFGIAFIPGALLVAFAILFQRIASNSQTELQK